MKNKPKVESASTLVLPRRSLKRPHQPVVSADSSPIVVVIMASKRAALAWTAGSDTQRAEGIRRGSSVSSVSSLTTNRSLGFGTKKVVPGSGKSEYGLKCGPRGSIKAYKGMLALSEEKLEVICCLWFHSWRPYKLLHAI